MVFRIRNSSATIHLSNLVAIVVLLVATLCHAGDSHGAEPLIGPGPFEHAVVAADHPLASQVGVEILQAGGNVVDAAVGVSFSLSVLRPEGCGIGGGGFMLIWDAELQQSIAIDYRERAPAAATREMFQSDDADSDPELSRHGGLAVGIPGTVAGLSSALREHGTMSLQEVLRPVIRLAEQGFPVDEQFRNVQLQVLEDFARHDGYAGKFAALYELYLGNGEAASVGDRFESPILEVLSEVSQTGSDAFYKGKIADAITAEVRRQGGILSTRDLSRMAFTIRQPLQSEFDGYEVLAMPPPSSGGVAIIEMLNMLTAFESKESAPSLKDLPQNSPEYVHLLTEIMKHAFADRAEHLGDADFADVPVDWLTSDGHARELASRVDMEQTQLPDSYGRHHVPDDSGTSHFSIIDAAGNAVACTETINTLFGSYVVVPEYGIILNNEMDDFSARPGEPNAFRLIQGEANAVEPGKKPLSSMSPTILVRDGKAVFAAGASGGPRIINGTLQVLLNMVRHDQLPQQAVATPRFHHQWQPNSLMLEESLLSELRQPLEARGHVLVERSSLGTTQAVSRSELGLFGGSDPRKGGMPAGY